MLLRPEQLRLGAPTGGIPQARVRSIDFYGHDSRVWLDLPDGATVIARLEGADLPVVGQEVGITVVGAHADEVLDGVAVDLGALARLPARLAAALPVDDDARRAGGDDVAAPGDVDGEEEQIHARQLRLP